MNWARASGTTAAPAVATAALPGGPVLVMSGPRGSGRGRGVPGAWLHRTFQHGGGERRHPGGMRRPGAAGSHDQPMRVDEERSFARVVEALAAAFPAVPARVVGECVE